MIGLVTFDANTLAASLALLLTALGTFVSNVQRKRKEFGEQDAVRLSQYERWRPKVRILVAQLRDLLAAHGIAEPDGVDDALKFPPKDEKVKPDE